MCFFKKFIQFKARAHHADFPLSLALIAVSFKIIKIITVTYTDNFGVKKLGHSIIILYLIWMEGEKNRMENGRRRI